MMKYDVGVTGDKEYWDTTLNEKWFFNLDKLRDAEQMARIASLARGVRFARVFGTQIPDGGSGWGECRYENGKRVFQNYHYLMMKEQAKGK